MMGRHPSKTALATGMAAFAVLVLCALIAWVVVLSSLRSPWDPIGEFPQQTIVEVTPTSVTVEGTKCYDEAVSINGEFWWQSVEPPGRVLAVKSGAASRDAGCISQIFENQIPGEVLAAELDAGPIVWRIVGAEEPIDQIDGRVGLVHVWETEAFRLDGN